MSKDCIIFLYILQFISYFCALKQKTLTFK